MTPTFLLLLLLFLQGASSSFGALRPSSSVTQSAAEKELRRLVREQLAPLREGLQASLSAYLEQEEEEEDDYEPSKVGIRTKRATISADNPALLERRRRKTAPPTSEKGTYVVTKSFRLSPQPLEGLDILDLNSLVYKNTSYLFALIRYDTAPNEVVLYKVNAGLSLELMWQMEVPGATLIEIVEISKAFYILPLVPFSSPSEDIIDIGSILYRVDFQRRSFRKVQTISTAHARACAFGKGSGEEANNVFLAVAPEFHTDSGKRSVRVEVRLFLWQGGYFDYVSSVFASRPQSIAFFNANSADFLVVANFQDDTGSTSVYSEIFHYQQKNSKFVPFQRIRTYGAKDIKHFSLSSGHTKKEHFLAVANHCQIDEHGKKNYNVKSFIMKLVSRRFILFKSFATYGAHEFLPVTLENKFFLVLADLNGLKIFQYNGWSFVQTYEERMSQVNSPMKLRPFVFQQEPFYTVSSNASDFPQRGIYSVQMTLKDDYTKLTSDLERWCFAAKEQVYSVDFDEFIRRFQAAPKINDSTISFSHPLTFSGKLVADKVQTQSLEYNGRRLDGALGESLVALKEESLALRKKVDAAVVEMKNVAYVDGSHKFTGPIHISSALYTTNPDLRVDHLQVNDTLNGYHLQSLLPNVILRNQDYSFDKLHANHVKISGEIYPRMVNNIDLRHYALLNETSLTFTARNTFYEEITIAHDVKVVNGVFGGVDFSHPPKFLLAEGNQTFSEIYVEHSHAAHLHTKLVNGQEVDYFYNEAVPLDADGVILTGHKEWTNVIVEGDVSVKGLINGRPVSRIISNAVYTTAEYPQKMLGVTHFENVVAKDVKLPRGPQVSGVDLQKDLVSIEASAPPQHFASIVVAEDSAVDTLLVTKSLNHIRVRSEDGQLDIFLRDAPHQSLSWKTFTQDISMISDVRAENLVDGVDIKNWSGSRRILLDKTTFTKKVVINGDLITPHKMTARRSFKQGERDLLPILRYIAPLSSKRIPGSCALHFHSLNVEGNTLIRRDLNGQQKPLESWLRREARQPYNISGVTWIHGDVYLEQHVDSYGLYGHQESKRNLLEVLPHLLIDGAEQTIPGNDDIHFSHVLRADEISCPETLLLPGNIPFSSLLLKNTPQTVLVPSSFTAPVTIHEDLEVSGDIEGSVQEINGVDLRKEIKDTLLKRTTDGVPQVIQGKWNISGELESTEMETDGYVNRVDLHKFLQSLVLSNHTGPLRLYSKSLVLESEAEVTSLHIDNSSVIHDFLRGSEWGSQKHWLLKTGDQTVFTPIQFSEGVVNVSSSPLTSLSSSQVHVERHSGTVVVVDVAELDKNVIRRHLGGTLRGTTVFEDELEIRNHLELSPSALVNGKDLKYSAVLKNRTKPLVFYEPRVLFTHGVDIYGNLLLHGKVDTLDINPAIRFLFPNESASYSYSNESLLVRGNLLLKVEPYVRSTVNGMDLYKLLDKVWFTDSTAVIRHEPTFQNVSFEGHHTPSLVVGSEEKSLLIGNIDIRDIEDTYVSRTKDQVWTGSVSFGTASFNALNTKAITIEEGLFNGKDIETFAASILLNNTDQELLGRWDLKSLRVNEILGVDGSYGSVTVNGVDMLKDFLRLGAPYGNKVTGLKVVTEELDVEEIVFPHNESISLGGVDMERWKASSVKTHGDHVFEGPLNLQNFYGNLRVEGLVDGVQVDKDHILLRKGSQVIPGRMVVDLPDEGLPNTAAALTAPQGIYVNGLFNEYNLNETLGHLVLKSDDSPLLIYGEKKFVAPIHVTQVTTAQLFHGYNLTRLFEDFYSGLAIPSDLHFRAHQKYSLLEDFTKQLSTKPPVFLESFIFKQQLTHSNISYLQVLYGLPQLTLAIGVEDSSGVTKDSWWNFDQTSSLFDPSYSHALRITGEVESYREIDTEEGSLFLLLGVKENNRRPPNVEVRKDPSYLESKRIPGRRSKIFILKQTTDASRQVKFTLIQAIWTDESPLIHTFDDSTGRLASCFLSADGVLYCPTHSNSHFAPLHTLPVSNISLATSMEGLGRTFLIALSGSSAEVLTYTEATYKFKSSTCIPLIDTISIDSVFGPNHIPFFAAASSRGFVAIYKYSLDVDYFQKSQTIDMTSPPLQVKFLRTKPSSEVFLFILTTSGKLLVYKYKGLSGWSLEHEWLTQPDAQLLTVFDFTIDDTHYLTQIVVSSPTSSQIYSATFKGLFNEKNELYLHIEN